MGLIDCLYSNVLFTAVSTEILMDDETFRSTRFQCVYQYLRRYYSAKSLSRFIFVPHTVEGDAQNALNLLLL